MLDCGTVREELSAYIDNELPSAERREIEQHLQVCMGCFKEYMQLQATSAIMRSLREIEPPPGFNDRVKERLRQEEKRGMWQRIARKPWHSLGAAAAALLLVIGAWSWFLDGGLARFPGTLSGPPAVADKEAGLSREAAEVQLFAADADAAAEERAAEEAVLQQSPAPVQEAAKPGDEPGTEEASTLAPADLPAGEEESAVYEIALGPAPEQAAGEAQEQESTARALMLPQGLPSGAEGLVIEISITTEDPEQGRSAVESLAYRNGLEVAGEEENGVTVLEMTVPLHLQRNIIEQLRGIGFVTAETVSDPELGEKVNELSRRQEELRQQQGELNALLASGGSVAERQEWEEELARIQGELETIQEEIGQLEQELPPAVVRIIFTQ